MYNKNDMTQGHILEVDDIKGSSPWNESLGCTPWGTKPRYEVGIRVIEESKNGLCPTI
jgi:hypothetical protein